ncbi:MAG: hypothetical protein V4550_03125 [Gemmatimonadota bacterium]
MHRLVGAACAACCLSLALAPASANAQAWNDPRSRELVERATARRAQQLADTGLKDYKALAHGYVTFLAAVGEGLAEPPKVVKADELMNEVYWLAPNLSKQRILGRRDTLLLPTDIAYHRDHLGIVQNNFPAIIRLGDGDEVIDVPHPLSDVGLATYDFAISDSLSFQYPGRTVRMLEVKVRPKNDRQPRIIGALYIDRDDAQVVRMAFNFTRAAFRDNALEDLFVIIENSLVSGRFWLPHRQEIEIRRGGTWLDYPIRGIIRGRWDIGDYDVNIGLTPAFFNGPEIAFAPKIVTDSFHFGGRILDSLPPDVRAVTDIDIQKVRDEARSLVRAQALRRPQALSMAATGISDFVHYNRAEGLAVGGGIASRVGGGYGAQFRMRYGIDDRTVKGTATLDWQSPAWGVRVFGLRDHREAGDMQERSRVINSLAGQEFGADATDPYSVEGAGIGIDARTMFGFRLKLDASVERQRPLTIRATPAQGSFDPLVAAAPVRSRRVSLAGDRPTTLWYFGTEMKASGEIRVADSRSDDRAVLPRSPLVTRGFGQLTIEKPTESGRLAVLLAGGVVYGSHRLPQQELLYFGGPVSAPGYAFHELRGDVAATTRLEWRTAVPAPSFSLGRFGRTPAQATVAPFVQGTYLHRAIRTDLTHADGVYPSVGVAVQPFFDLLRFQLARGLRNGRWSFNVDVARDLWSVL